jgi:hypothetical protein
MSSTCCGEHERTFTAIGPIMPESNSISNSATVVVAVCGHGSIPYSAVALGKTENFTIIDLVVHGPMRHATFRPRAITDDLFAGKVDGTKVVLGFDCGCRSKINFVERHKAQNNGELPIYNVETVVGEFHGRQHKPSCYEHNSQFNVNYTALEQLDGGEPLSRCFVSSGATLITSSPCVTITSGRTLGSSVLRAIARNTMHRSLPFGQSS